MLSFCSMKQLGVLLLPPGWDASPSQGTHHKATTNFTSPLGWDAGPSQGTQHEVRGVLLLSLDGMLVHHSVTPTFC